MHSTEKMQWSKIPSSMTTKRSRCAAAAVDGKLFVVGGHDDKDILSSCEVYDQESQQWSSLPSMTTKRYGCAAEVVDGKLFVVGGWDGKNALSSCEVYNQQSKKWSSLLSMTTKRSGCGAAVIDGKLFVLGGYDGKNILSSCEVYGQKSKKWSSLPSMPTKLSSCEVYDQQSRRWSSFPSMTTKRSRCAVAVVDGKLFVVGGWDGKNALSSCEVYDQQSKKWSTLPSMTTKRSGCGAAVVDGKLFVLGGYDGKNMLSSCEVYDQQSQKWSSLPSMNTKRWGCAAAVVERKLFVLGGYDDNYNILSSRELLFIAKPVSPFYTKLIENDDRNINFKITELVPMVEDIHQVKFIYTLAKNSCRLGYLDKDEYGQYIRSALKQAARLTSCKNSVAAFKIVLDKAEEDGIIDKFTKNVLDRDSEVTHTSNAPFVNDLWEHIHANTARIQGLEMRVDRLEARTERLETRTERLEACCKDFYLCLDKLQKGITFNRKMDAVTGMMSAVLNAISFGVVGSVASGAMKLAINNIVDFGDVSHMRDVVNNLGDVTVHDALNHAVATTDRLANERLYQHANEVESILKGKLHTELIAAANNGNPLMAVAITAHFTNNNDTNPVPIHGNVTNCPPQKPMLVMDRVPQKPMLVMDRVQALEEKLSLENVPTAIIKRIENLELCIYGEIHSGPLLGRVTAVEELFGFT